jgi:hypothetical protein
VNFKSKAHFDNYLRFVRNQRNAGEAASVLRGQTTNRELQAQLLRLERAFYEMPDKTSRNVLKTLLRRSMRRTVSQFRSNWIEHPARVPSQSLGLPSVRKAAAKVIQADGDVKGIRTTAYAGLRTRRNPRSRLAPVLNGGHVNWRVREQTASQLPRDAILDDLRKTIENDFAELCRKRGLRVTA